MFALVTCDFALDFLVASATVASTYLFTAYWAHGISKMKAIHTILFCAILCFFFNIRFVLREFAIRTNILPTKSRIRRRRRRRGRRRRGRRRRGRRRRGRR